MTAANDSYICSCSCWGDNNFLISVQCYRYVVAKHSQLKCSQHIISIHSSKPGGTKGKISLTGLELKHTARQN